MPFARTVRGDVPVEDLGITLSHEHFIYTYGHAPSDFRYDVEDLAERVCEPLRPAVEELSVKTVVEATPSDSGRSMPVFKRVAEMLDIHVIGSTGFYKTGMGMPGYIHLMDLDNHTDLLVHELQEGVGADKIRCGLIKFATTAGEIDYMEEKAIRAAARASKITGAPVHGHCDPDGWDVTNVGLRQLEILMDEGLDPSRYSAAHASGSSNFGHLLELVKLGSYISMDQLGIEMTVTDPTGKAIGGGVTDDVRLGIIAGLCAMGYADKIMLSTESVAVFFPKNFEHPDPGWKARRFVYAFRDFVPRMREVGVSEEDIHKIMVTNAQDYLAFAKS